VGSLIVGCIIWEGGGGRKGPCDSHTWGKAGLRGGLVKGV